MDEDSYARLAQRLDSLPNGYPAVDGGAEQRLFVGLFTPEEADLAAQLCLPKGTPAQFASRTGRDCAWHRPASQVF